MTRTSRPSGLVGPPRLLVQRRADRVVEVDLVEVVDVGDPGAADGVSLLALADQAERRALLGAHRIAAALAAGDGHHAGARAVPLAPTRRRPTAVRPRRRDGRRRTSRRGRTATTGPRPAGRRRARPTLRRPAVARRTPIVRAARCRRRRHRLGLAGGRGREGVRGMTYERAPRGQGRRRVWTADQVLGVSKSRPSDRFRASMSTDDHRISSRPRRPSPVRPRRRCSAAV